MRKEEICFDFVGFACILRDAHYARYYVLFKKVF